MSLVLKLKRFFTVEFKFRLEVEVVECCRKADKIIALKDSVCLVMGAAIPMGMHYTSML